MCNKGNDASVIGNDTSRILAIITEGDLAECDRLAFNSEGDITKGGQLCQGVNVTTTSAFAKRASLLTKATSAVDGGFANEFEVAKDGNLAIDGNLAKERNCAMVGNVAMKGNFAEDRCLPPPWQATWLKVDNIAKEGNFATKGAC
jgi:hypothetical protein